MIEHAHCRCMDKNCKNRHFSDCDICKPNGNEQRRQGKEKEMDDRLEQVKIAFEKFYLASPMVGREGMTAAQVRVAMQGAYMAGFILLGEELKKHL